MSLPNLHVCGDNSYSDNFTIKRQYLQRKASHSTLPVGATSINDQQICIWACSLSLQKMQQGMGASPKHPKWQTDGASGAT